jgi:hypothetical protein
MARLADLPEGFDPEEHDRRKRPEALSEGVHLIEHRPEAGFYLLAKVKGTGAAKKTIRCWHCYKNPDGSIDCFEVDCPFTV